MSIGYRRTIVLAGVLAACGSLAAWASSPAESYLKELEGRLKRSSSKSSEFTRSAEVAADAFLSGGNLWAAGRQEDFIGEACGRAGGLMAIAPLGKTTPTNHDVVLYAVPGKVEDSDRNIIQQWRTNGVVVIEFTSAAGVFAQRFPIDTVANVAELWAWTGELVAACTRHGKMPVLYESYGLPGGPERGRKYQGKRVHDDLQVKPLAPGVLTQQYYSRIDTGLEQLRKTEMKKLRQAAKWWREAPGTNTITFVIGHMFPHHFRDPRAGSLCAFETAPPWEDKDLLANLPDIGFVFYLGYQRAPAKLVEHASRAGVKLVYADVQPAQPPEPAKNVIYINPGFPLTDACVTVPGYDIPILPASGVLQAAMFWAMAAEMKSQDLPIK